MTVTEARPQPASELVAIVADAVQDAIEQMSPDETPETGSDLIARAVFRSLWDHPATLTTLLAAAMSEMAAESPDRSYETVIAGSPAEPAWHLTVRAVCTDQWLAGRRLKAANLSRIEVANAHAHEYHDRLERWLAELGVVVPPLRRSA